MRFPVSLYYFACYIVNENGRVRRVRKKDFHTCIAKETEILFLEHNGRREGREDDETSGGNAHRALHDHA